MRYTRLLLLGLLALAATLTNGTAVQAASTFTVDSTGDAVDANPGDGTCATAGAVCTLRAAIEESNALVGTDTINFNIAGAGPHTISPGSALPTIIDAVTIDGTSEPDFAGTPIVELDGSGAGLYVDGLVISAGSSTVRGLVINRFWDGIGIELSTNGGNSITGNYIGTDVTGTASLGNYYGVIIYDAPGNTIGGTAAGAGNVISGNIYSGIYFMGSGATGNQVQGNYIGTDVTGTADLGNYTYYGMVINGPGNTIGGTASGAGNVISGNESGVFIVGSIATGNQVQGNYIGTDVTGTADLGNDYFGVRITGPGNTIGGTATGVGNVISGNDQYGVYIIGSSATGNMVQGNYIGTDVTGTADLGNSYAGVYINDAPGNTIGGTAAGAGNVIAFNGGDGVFVLSGTVNLIGRNSIHSNSGLGIDLDPDYVTPNDTGDPDTGPNNLQNFPVLTAASSGSSTTIKGDLNSTASTTFTLEFFSNATCDPSGNGEGETFIGSTTETTDGSGDVSFTHVIGMAVPVGQFITATATDPNGNTSEFSECEEVLLDSDGDGVPDSEDNCPYWPNPGQGLPPWPVPAGDPDCDGFPSTVTVGMTGAETDIGTDPADACPDTPDPNDEADDCWPPDWDDTQTVNLLDLLPFKLHFNATDPDPLYEVRYDLNVDDSINLLDMLPFKPFFNLSCTP